MHYNNISPKKSNKKSINNPQNDKIFGAIFNGKNFKQKLNHGCRIVFMIPLSSA